MAGTWSQAAAQAVIRALAAATVVLCVVCFGGAAWAHASLVSAAPSDGSVLAEAPSTVELRFNESITVGSVNLVDAKGKPRIDATVEAGGDEIRILLPASLPRGTSVVSYRVISQDGHPVAGSITFSVGAPTATRLPESGSAVIAGLIWLTRLGVYAGLFAGIGGVFFLIWIAREKVAVRIILAALAAGIVSAVIYIGLQGLNVLGSPLPALLSAAPWRIAVGTSLGVSLLMAIATMIISVVALRGKFGLARGLSALALAGGRIALAASGHTATASPQVLMRPAMLLHATGVVFWLGALMPLAVLLRRKKGASLLVVQRFSRFAVAVVVILVLTGLALAAVQLESPSALFETKYGIILLIKLLLVAALLGLAALNRFRFTPALAHGSKSCAAV